MTGATRSLQMAKKVVRYTLTAQGTIPEEIEDGGYFPKANSNASPQDWDLIGVTKDGSSFTGEQEFTAKSALTTYMTSIGAPFENKTIDDEGNEVDGETTAADAATLIWDKKTA